MDQVERREEFSSGEGQCQLQRHWSRSHIQNSTGDFAHHVAKRSECKKVQMSCIEDARVGRVEISKEEAEANAPVRDVRHRDEDFAGIFQRRDGPAQYRDGIAQMLQNIGKEDVIEDMAIRKGKRLDIGAVKNVIVSASFFRSFRMAFDSGDRVSLFFQHLPQIAVSTTHIQNPERIPLLFDFFQYPVVATVLEILKDVAAPRISPGSQYALL